MSDPVLTITLGGNVPACKQIVDQLRLLIQTEKLLPGYDLPGVRSLAAQLGVHHNTVAEAFRTLASEGLLDLSHGRRATIKSRRKINKLTPQQHTNLRIQLRALVAELRSKGVPANTILHDINTVLGS